MDFSLDALSDDGARSRQATMGHRVFETLQQAIVQLQLRPGNLLSEAEVAKQLGVSRQPVREAFIKLADLGLVEIRPQRGTFVMLISRREVENARFIREAIEVAVARKAAIDAKDSAIAQLRRILAHQQEACETENVVEFLKHDDAFHRALAQCADCEHAWRVIENLKTQMDRVRYLSMPMATPLETLISQHTEIVDAVEAHDPDAAERAMRAHLAEIVKSLPKIAAAHPELFVE